MLNVSFPILVDGSVAYVVSLAIWPREIVGILAGLSLGPEWVTTVWDNAGAIVARSRELPRYLGRQLPERLAGQGQDRKVYRTRGLDDVEVWRAVSVSNVSGLGVAVNVTGAYAAREATGGVWFLAGISIAGVLLAVGLSLVFARSISVPLARASAAAVALGRNEPPVLVHSRLAEANAVSHALGRAFDEIKERTALLGDSRRQLAAVLEILPLGIALVDTSGRTILSNSSYGRFVPGGIPSSGGHDLALWEAYDAQGDRLEGASFPGARALRGERVWPGQLFLYHGDRQRGAHWTNVAALPFRDQAGVVVGATIVIQDVDEEHRAADEKARYEVQKTLLVNELNHRVKNMLATVQAVAIQTFKGPRANPEGIEAFQARLRALASAHDVLTRENWQRASVREIVDGALAPYCGRGEVPFDVRGPDVSLAPRAALALAMALHELCTNALKYGALSVSAGRVEITWSVDDRDHFQCLRLRWKENGGPSVSEPRRKGFGTRMIETVLAQDLGARVALTYAPDGFECVIDAPLDEGASVGSRASAARNPG